VSIGGCDGGWGGWWEGNLCSDVAIRHRCGGAWEIELNGREEIEGERKGDEKICWMLL
jgi:hypothetical protein